MKENILGSNDSLLYKYLDKQMFGNACFPENLYVKQIFMADNDPYNTVRLGQYKKYLEHQSVDIMPWPA